MINIKERPILFSAPMVRAILEGRKTVTRRPVKGVGLVWLDNFKPEYVADPDNNLCPYCKPGDRLWVRETWYCDHDEVQRGPYLQPADMTDLDEARENGDLVYAADGLTPYEQDQPKWKPSIHTPRWVSRILLEITDIRVERLQGISDEQAVSEGCFFTDYGRKCGHGGKGWTDVGACPAPESTHQQREGWMWDKTTSHEQCLDAPRWAFANLWNAVNGPDAWDSNPWVWVIEFKQVMP